jgi:hypothetical protein
MLSLGRGSALWGPNGSPSLVLLNAPMSRAAARMRHWRLVTSFNQYSRPG